MSRLSAVAPGIAAVLLALFITVLGAAPAHAHATLLATDPGQGAQLGTAPAEVRLTFSEPVTTVPGGVRLLRAGQQAEILDARTVDTAVVALLPDLAPDARYTIAWRVVSADGHPVSGLFAFTLGDPPPDAPAPSAEDTDSSAVLEVAQSVTTGIWYAGLLLVAGLLAFQVFCVRPVAGSGRPVAAGSALVGVAVVAGGLAALALVPLRAAGLADGLPAESASWAVLAGWRNPLAALLTGVGLAAAWVLQRRGRTGAALGCAAVALVSPTLTGHSAAVEPGWLMIAGDLVHLAAAAVWAGGVLGLVLYLRGIRQDMAGFGQDAGTAVTTGATRNAARVVARFSGLAGSTVFTVGLAGVVMALLILPERSALTGTEYGRLLLLKLTLVALAAGLGGWNRFRLLPALERPGAAADPWRALARILRIEVAVLAAVVVVTGFLVGHSPTGAGDEHSGHGHAGHDHSAATGGPAPIRGTSERLVVTGTATPLAAGMTQLRFTVADGAGARVQPLEPPTVTATLPAQDLGPARYESRDSPTDPPGTYVVDVETPLPGRWQVLVGVRVSTFTQETVRVDLTVG